MEVLELTALHARFQLSMDFHARDIDALRAVGVALPS
jgi:hypothetical protein